MKTSEVIKELCKMSNKHGDLEVGFINMELGCYESINSIKLVNSEPTSNSQ